MLRVLIAIGLIAAWLTAGGAAQAADWRSVASEDDAAKIDGLDSARDNAALHLSKQQTPDAQTARTLLGLPATPVAAQKIGGAWRCRSVQVGAEATYAYGFFACRVDLQGGEARLVKTTGSQRFTGLLIEDPRGLVFVGAAHMGLFEGERAYGAKADMDRVGLLRALGPARLLLELPNDNDYELIELVR